MVFDKIYSASHRFVDKKFDDCDQVRSIWYNHCDLQLHKTKWIVIRLRRFVKWTFHQLNRSPRSQTSIQIYLEWLQCTHYKSTIRSEKIVFGSRWIAYIVYGLFAYGFIHYLFCWLTLFFVGGNSTLFDYWRIRGNSGTTIPFYFAGAVILYRFWRSWWCC